MECISPIDGRYNVKTASLRPYFSDFALMRYRVKVEIEYLLRLARALDLHDILDNELDLKETYLNFDHEDWLAIINWEDKINHDVKAVEMYLRDELKQTLSKRSLEFIHFGLTSQDINNTALPLMLKDGLCKVIFPAINKIFNQMTQLIDKADLPMLGRTHGQPATPTKLSIQLAVFRERLRDQMESLNRTPLCAKFGGATGGMNAHYAAFPNINWHSFAKDFIRMLGLRRSFPTTQIEHYDNLAGVCHAFSRINTILIDLCRDVWQYISMGYFTLERDANQVGSSTMPHKVNPINFENAEGNLGFANAIFEHMARKLPISRLQRDLSDCTVLRNLGVPFAHSLVAYQNIVTGLGKLKINTLGIRDDLNDNWAVLTEAVQTILRREGVVNGYDLVKKFVQRHPDVSKRDLHRFIDSLPISTSVKVELRRLTPENYTGK